MTKKLKTQNKLDSTTTTKNALDGLGMSPRPLKQHQSAITDVVVFFQNLFKSKKKNLKALPETELGKPNSLAPDVVIIKKTTEENVTFVEITNTKGQKIAIAKSKIAIEEFMLKEGFIYNYLTKTWYRVDENGVTKDSKSTTLGIDLSNIKIE